MSFLKQSDFKGPLKISKNDLSDIQDYLDVFENEYLTDLLGCDLFDQFIADLDINLVPQTARFISIYNAFCIDLDFSCNINRHYNPEFIDCICLTDRNKSRGIFEMLKGFMFFEFVRDSDKGHSSIGTTKAKPSASRLVKPSATGIIRAYNHSLKDYWNIQYFISQDEDLYPEYNGIIKTPIGIL